jgi:hypothetical protein
MSITFFAQTTNTVIKQKIIIEKNQSVVTLTGTAENLSEVVQSFSYKLSVIKKNSTSDNQSTNEQEGFYIECERK